MPTLAATKLHEANFDGIVGPTHNYAGLSPGNVASLANRGRLSSPKRAALQGLAKAKFLADLGIPQFVLPPQPRPDLGALARVGFNSSLAGAIHAAGDRAAHLLASCSSASSMWAANAATVAPSTDTADAALHLTPANLFANFHRSIEPPHTTRVLRAALPFACVHDALPATHAFADEGAANHTRLEVEGLPALHLFVYGRNDTNPDAPRPSRHAARQTRQACAAIARLHRLPADRVVFAQQNPDAIDSGVFHNDVIAVGHGRSLMLHERAYTDTNAVIDTLQQKLGGALRVRLVTEDEVPLQDAVRSYLFNGQLVGGAGEAPTLVHPADCGDVPSVRDAIARMMDEGFLASACAFDLRESMRNGGGPACLRLRVPMTDDQLASIPARLRLDDALFADLTEWIERTYRDELHPRDLADPLFAREALDSVDELATILELEAARPVG